MMKGWWKLAKVGKMMKIGKIAEKCQKKLQTLGKSCARLKFLEV